MYIHLILYNDMNIYDLHGCEHCNEFCQQVLLKATSFLFLMRQTDVEAIYCTGLRVAK